MIHFEYNITDDAYEYRIEEDGHVVREWTTVTVDEAAELMVAHLMLVRETIRQGQIPWEHSVRQHREQQRTAEAVPF